MALTGRVLIVTADGRVLVGSLAGFDQTTNVVLSQCAERIFAGDAPVEEVPLGVYVVRGDNITLIGGVDEALDDQIDLASIRAEPIAEMRH